MKVLISPHPPERWLLSLLFFYSSCARESEVVSHCSSDLHFPDGWCWPGAYWTLADLLWRHVYSNPAPVLKWDRSSFSYWVVSVPSRFQIKSLTRHCLQCGCAVPIVRDCLSPFLVGIVCNTEILDFDEIQFISFFVLLLVLWECVWEAFFWLEVAKTYSWLFSDKAYSFSSFTVRSVIDFELFVELLTHGATSPGSGSNISVILEMSVCAIVRSFQQLQCDETVSWILWLTESQPLLIPPTFIIEENPGFQWKVHKAVITSWSSWIQSTDCRLRTPRMAKSPA